MLVIQILYNNFFNFFYLTSFQNFDQPVYSFEDHNLSQNS